MQRRFLLQLAAGSLAGLAGPPGVAQSWPPGPVRIVVGFPRGGGTDALARVLAQRFAPRWNQAVEVENKAGVAGVLAAGWVAQQPGDGRTLLMAHVNSHALAPLLLPRLGYRVEQDFMPIMLVGVTPNMLVTHPGQPARSLPEMIELCRARPGEVSVGAAGAGSVQHLSLEMLQQRAGIRLLHIPYKGAGPVLQDVMNREIQYGLVSMAAATPALKAGQVIAMAQTRSRRSGAHPTVPTLAEQGFPDFEATAWYGLVGPGRLPRTLAQRFNEEANQVLALPDVQARLKGLGVEDGGGSIEKFAGFMRAEIARWSKVVKQGSLRP